MLTGIDGYGMFDDYADVHIYIVLESMCNTEKPRSLCIPEKNLTCIHEYMAACGLVDGTGKPTERAYDLYNRIPITNMGTVITDTGFLSAVCIRGYEDNKEHDSIVSRSGLLIANIVEQSTEIVGTNDVDIACAVGMMMGKNRTKSGDLVLGAISNEPSLSEEWVLSIALKLI